jgi:two-component system heavy metal sensor histidine kinase CusS
MFSILGKSASLRFRLALIFFAGSLATMVVATGYLYLAFKHEINARNQRMLQGRLQDVASILARPRDSRETLEEEVLDELPTTSSIPSNTHIGIRILNDGTVLLESHDIKRFPPDRFGGKSKIRRHHSVFILAERQEGDHRIQGVLDVTGDEHMILNYRIRLAYTLLLGVGICSALGWIAAHRGLKPLRAIAESTRGITAQRLRQRLDPGDVPQELRHLVHALNDMLDRLDQAFERLSRFSADLAHELRTPITNLMGEAEVVLSRERPAEEYRQVLESSMDEFRRVSRLISRMLFLARAEDPGSSITPVPIDSERLLGDVLAFFEAAAEEQGVKLHGEAKGTLRGDADMLRQALSNLVSNALAATPEGGETSDENRAELEVRDTGRGIPLDELPHVFDRFYRTGEAFSRKVPGTGLGLALVQSIAYLHGGEVRITSEPGKGTSVVLRFLS